MEKNNDKKISYKYVVENDGPGIKFEWDTSKSKIILIEKDQDIDLNDLYDYMIDNVDEILFEDLSDSVDDITKEKVVYLSFQAVISAIKEEFKIIKKEYKKIMNNNKDSVSDEK